MEEVLAGNRGASLVEEKVSKGVSGRVGGGKAGRKSGGRKSRGQKSGGRKIGAEEWGESREKTLTANGRREGREKRDGKAKGHAKEGREMKEVGKRRGGQEREGGQRRNGQGTPKTNLTEDEPTTIQQQKGVNWRRDERASEWREFYLFFVLYYYLFALRTTVFLCLDDGRQAVSGWRAEPGSWKSGCGTGDSAWKAEGFKEGKQLENGKEVSGWWVWAKGRVLGFPTTNLIGGIQNPVESRDLIRGIPESKNFLKNFDDYHAGNHFANCDNTL
jgi:hypothetical protein